MIMRIKKQKKTFKKTHKKISKNFQIKFILASTVDNSTI